MTAETQQETTTTNPAGSPRVTQVQIESDEERDGAHVNERPDRKSDSPRNDGAER